MYAPPPRPPPIPPPPFDPNGFNWARIERNERNAARRHQEILQELRWHRKIKYAILAGVIVLLMINFLYNVALMEKTNAIHTLTVS